MKNRPLLTPETDRKAIYGTGGEWTWVNEDAKTPKREDLPELEFDTEEVKAEVVRSTLHSEKVPTEAEILDVVVNGKAPVSPKVVAPKQSMTKTLSHELNSHHVLLSKAVVGMFGLLSICGVIYLVVYLAELLFEKISSVGASIAANSTNIKTAGISFGLLCLAIVVATLLFLSFRKGIGRDKKKRRDVNLFKECESRSGQAHIVQNIIINNKF